ncbi:bacillithiol biosynthesis cysteine-adding enzyme BshC [Aquibacillus halophilus]|uniref:Putative cysteine ligase BshC n=1 Tax=Aquibacillus halophilus TaxID=930132 RepID=A0A6A8DC96_9BACI|nr:bacillithiol biosynthesis cysteine-adding enzyme BshC [Aquibacillus halophilus]MRH42156.1 bacillithiol biosynthesis cysteine-adding enzyme BshC [Aquibacillus halophilus]
MRIDPIKLETKNKLIDEYRNNGEIMNKFDYLPFEASTFQQRFTDLQEREFDREGLATVLQKLNDNWGAPAATLENIERLKDKDSVVVIGGQQSGLLTGPLYTINKIISIINLAKQQERQLKVPVVPVFWIAGEDHDFAEINHIMLEKGSRMKKYKIPQRVSSKTSMSELDLDKDIAKAWLHRVFGELQETEFTNSYLELFEKCLNESNTTVDFFAKVIFSIFNKEGLVLIDSGNKLVRQLESEHFVTMIKNQQSVSEGVYQANQEIKQSGYSISMDVEENEAHLFYHKDGERILLVRSEDGSWIGKQNECEFTTDELLHIAKNNPELLSNNVVTRPLMQELLFPTLAFLGGLGEIGYWSILKPAFQTLEIKMPPILPRLSLSLVDRSTDKKLKKFSIPPNQIVNFGVELERGNWLATQTSSPIEMLTDQVKFSIERAHRPLKELAKEIRSDLGDVAEKNLFYLFQDIEFLEDKLMRALEEKYHQGLDDFDTLQTMLRPEGGLQERCWNIIPFLNLYGDAFIDQLSEQSYDYKVDHYLIYL